MDITTRKRAIIVPPKEQTSLVIHDIAHSIAASKSSVSRLLKIHSEIGFVSSIPGEKT
jgi:DNA-binding MarR family transcriptional regulator